MKTFLVNLGHKNRAIFNALDRNERVILLFRGQVKGIVHPVTQVSQRKISEHAFFGMHADADIPVNMEMERIRQLRHTIRGRAM